ncbi:hypothetical protein HYX12_04335 [Candidatus Woesearchaeota archaeon]|nr:hypothetical protein [Candidatus Woesearchaeota archaeon]
MTNTFQADMKFSLNEEDSKLYHKYGVPAVELAKDGEYLAAVKLLDKILKINPQVEFALLLKANYMFNYVNKNFEMPEVIPENVGKIKSVCTKIKKELEECISLIDQAHKLNPKNKNAIDLKTFIEKNSLKQAKQLLASIEEKDEIIDNDNSFACPYCEREINVKNGVQDKEMEIECGLCHKKCKCITGVIQVIRGRTNAVVQYGPEPIAITLKLSNGTETINFQTHYRFLVHKGDKVSFIFLRKSNSSYEEVPSYIFNWSSGEIYIIKAVFNKKILFNPVVIVLGILFGVLGGVVFAAVVEVMMGIQDYGAIFYFLWILGFCIVYYLIALIASKA